MIPIFAALVFCHSIFAFAAAPNFRWLTRKTAPGVYRQIELSLIRELHPDPKDFGEHELPLTANFIYRVGAVGNSALVILAYREDSRDPYPAYRAFNFDLNTASIELIESGPKSWFPMWRFERLAHFDAENSIDVVFKYFSCTECESTELLASFKLDAHTAKWKLRDWGEPDGESLMIGSDTKHGDDGEYDYDCLRVIEDVYGGGLDDVVLRCRERVESDPNLPLKINWDRLWVYSTHSGRMAGEELKLGDPRRKRLNAQLCSTNRYSPLCPR